MKMLGRPDGFMLYGKMGVDFFSTSELLYPNMKIRLRLIRARPNLYLISDNPNLYTVEKFHCFWNVGMWVVEFLQDNQSC